MRVKTLFFSLLVGAVTSFAQTFHDVKPGETLYYISRTYGVTVESIVNANPGLSAQSLRAGSKIKIPTTVAAQAPSPARQGTAVQQVPAQSLPGATNAVVLLPMSAEGVEGERSIEFYRGFLLAAQKLANEGQRINVFAYDERLDEQNFSSTVEKLRQNGAQLIIGPVYPAHFQRLATLAREQRTRLVIPFYSKAEQVNTNPYVYLVNTPEKFEMEYTTDLFLKTFKNVNVAFMHIGSAGEQPFMQYLRSRLQARGYSVTEFSYEAPLEQMRSAASDKRPTVVIPDAGDADALSKVLAKMEGFKKFYPQYDLRLFGYEAWLNNLEPAVANRLHAANAYVPTGSYCNLYDPVTLAFNEAYVRAYGEEPLNVTPRMGLLGYDVALHMLTGIAAYGADFCTQSSEAPLLQTQLRFQRVEQGGGLVSNSLFFIHFRTDGQIERLAAKKR
ncbi:MAG: ABC transporter substrate-binding protein [Alloprevotella sp.]|nr:ABC transporter substrate-binding protein [Alloprevotella sp.]